MQSLITLEVIVVKDWVDVLSALGTPIIALMAAWIGYQQWQTSEKVRKNAAQQKYLDNYEKVADAVYFVVAKGKVDDEVLNDFLFARNEALLYLSPEIIQYTENLAVMAVDLSTLQEEMSGMPHGPEKIKKIRVAAELKKKLGGARPHEVYRKYLAID